MEHVVVAVMVVVVVVRADGNDDDDHDDQMSMLTKSSAATTTVSGHSRWASLTRSSTESSVAAAVAQVYLMLKWVRISFLASIL